MRVAARPTSAEESAARRACSSALSPIPLYTARPCWILSPNSSATKNKRQLKQYWPVVEEINEHAETLESLSDDELRGKTAEFKARIAEAVQEIETEKREIKARLRGAPQEDAVGGDGQAADPASSAGQAVGAATPLTLEERQAFYEDLDSLEKEWFDTIEATLNELLPEAFAVVKETCRRMVGKEWEAGGTSIRWEMIPYDVQLLGGIAIHQGKIAEMKTGEGKTLVAVAPVYLNALVGRGVHLVTVNPYLARRDAEWMEPIFNFLGLDVDVIDKYDAHSPGRREGLRRRHQRMAPTTSSASTTSATTRSSTSRSSSSSAATTSPSSTRWTRS